ncbi:hypothetical protein F4814DRAFT_451945 [Daldinia grandis]|nr:hypothetical protein F4814DRAFT_451945 [Daldinia grandis]
MATPLRSLTATATATASSSPQPKILLEDRDSGFGFVRHNPAPPKPRTRSVTEIRGPCYTVMGPRYLSDVRDAGVERVMIESEGITENAQAWRTDVIQPILRELPLENVMFEAADPSVFNWYVREFGVDVNLFVAHSQIVQLAGLRAGIWGKSDTFGKITTYRP